MSVRNKAYYQEQYVDLERSIYDIAAEHDTYPNKIRREIIGLGFHLRNKSEAQRAAIRHGRHHHPTKGVSRSDTTKALIGEAMSKLWANMGDEERARRAARSRQQWDDMGPEKQAEFRSLAAKSVRQATGGSKLEQFLLRALEDKGYKVGVHINDVDLYISSKKLAIDVLGPSHFFPIWGEENLESIRAKDSQKVFTLAKEGVTFIRIKHVSKTLSGVMKRNLLTELFHCMESPTEGGLHEIEVK